MCEFFMSYYVNYITFYILEALMQLLSFIYTCACIQIYINIEYNIINTFLIYLCIFFPFFFCSFATVVLWFHFQVTHYVKNCAKIYKACDGHDCWLLVGHPICFIILF